MDEEDYFKQMQAERQLELLKKQLFMRLLTKEARSRLSNIRVANPELAEQVELALIQIIQTGKIQQIDEQTLVTLIKRLKGSVTGTGMVRGQ